MFQDFGGEIRKDLFKLELIQAVNICEDARSVGVTVDGDLNLRGGEKVHIRQRFRRKIGGYFLCELQTAFAHSNQKQNTTSVSLG